MRQSTRPLHHRSRPRVAPVRAFLPSKDPPQKVPKHIPLASSELRQVLQSDYDHALDARYETEGHGHPGSLSPTSAMVAPLLKKIYKSSKATEACDGYSRLAELDGLIPVSPSVSELKQPSRHLIAVVVERRSKSAIELPDDTADRYKSLAYRLNQNGVWSVKRDMEMSEKVNVNAETVEGIQKQLANQYFEGEFCGFFEVSESTKEALTKKSAEEYLKSFQQKKQEQHQREVKDAEEFSKTFYDHMVIRGPQMASREAELKELEKMEITEAPILLPGLEVQFEGNYGIYYAVDAMALFSGNGLPGDMRYGRPDVSEKEVYDLQTIVNTSGNQDEVCAALNELAAIDGLVPVPAEEMGVDVIQKPKKHYVMILLKRISPDDLGRTFGHWLYFYRLGSNGKWTSKHKKEGISTRFSGGDMNGKRIEALTASLGEKVCGFYLVPSNIKSTIAQDFHHDG